MSESNSASSQFRVKELMAQKDKLEVEILELEQNIQRVSKNRISATPIEELFIDKLYIYCKSMESDSQEAW